MRIGRSSQIRRADGAQDDVKLGFKQPKDITSIEVTNQYPGGYWEDLGYNWFAGGIAREGTICAIAGLSVSRGHPSREIQVRPPSSSSSIVTATAPFADRRTFCPSTSATSPKSIK
jgi:hypothetical protein